MDGLVLLVSLKSATIFLRKKTLASTIIKQDCYLIVLKREMQQTFGNVHQMWEMFYKE